MQDRAPGRVTRREGHARAPGHVQRRAVAEGRDLAEVTRPESAMGRAEPQEAEERADLRGPPAFRRVRHLAARQGRIRFVDHHGYPMLCPETFREPDVVAVAVRED